MVDDPLNHHFYTILGLMDAQDPFLSCEDYISNHMPWLLHKLTLNPSILSHYFGEGGRARWTGSAFVHGKKFLLLQLCT